MRVDVLAHLLPLNAERSTEEVALGLHSLLNEIRQTLAALIDLVMADAIRNPDVKASIEASKPEIDAA